MFGEWFARTRIQADTQSLFRRLFFPLAARICQNNDWASCLPTIFFIWFLFACFYLGTASHSDDSSLWWICGLRNGSPIESFNLLLKREKGPSDASHFHLIKLMEINQQRIQALTCHFWFANDVQRWRDFEEFLYVSKIISDNNNHIIWFFSCRNSRKCEQKIALHNDELNRVLRNNILLHVLGFFCCVCVWSWFGSSDVVAANLWRRNSFHPFEDRYWAPRLHSRKHQQLMHTDPHAARTLVDRICTVNAIKIRFVIA